MQLNLLTIRSANLVAAADFYRALGLSFESHAHGSGPKHLSCETDGFVFEIYPLQAGDGPTSSTRLGFRVAQLDKSISRLRSHGGTVLSSAQATPWGRRAVVSDPDGHKIEVYEA